ncbi:MAG: cytochrome P450 [Actinobacteria bacterium]|nr:cytochrome P450 [Actinomycetota bacterium]
MAVAAPPASLGDRIDLWLAAEPEGLADPYGLFEEIRAAGRVVLHNGMAFVTGYDDVKALIRAHPGLSRQAASRGGRALAFRSALDDAHRRTFDEVSAIQELFISRTDRDVHARLRAIAHRAFTPRKIAALEEALQGFVDELIAREQGKDEADLMNLAYGLPLWAICHLLGASPADREPIHEWSLSIGANHGAFDANRLTAAHAAHGMFDAYVQDVIERHRLEPGSAGELVAALLDAEQGDRLTEAELSAMFVVLLFAGHETTTNLLGGGLRELLLRRDAWDALVADPSLLPNAIEEVLRYVTPVQFLFRYAIGEIEIGEDAIPAGATVFPLLPAANRDPDVFRDPCVLDIRRPEAGNHLALGFGPYFCLGASLARLEATVAFRTLLDRYPRMRLVDAEATHTGSAMLRRLVDLRVVLEP